MTNEEIREMIKQASRDTVAELIAQGVVDSNPKKVYLTTSRRLHAYYDEGETNEEMQMALFKVTKDRYFRIIPLYYSMHKTNEEIAEILDCDVSTVTRNKKRIVCDIAKNYKSL